MMSKISRSPTISVSPPQTPDSSDPFRFSLPMSEDSSIVRELRNENATLKKEIDTLKKTFQAKFDKQDAKIKELDTIIKKLTRPDIFDKLVDELNSQGVQSMVAKINSCNNDDKICKKVLGVNASKVEQGLDTLVTYLKVKDDPRLDGLFIDLFSQLKPFALKNVTSSDKNPSGTTNEFLRTHILKTSYRHSKRVKQSYELFEKFVKKSHPKFVHFMPLLLTNYRFDGQKGEPRASRMVSDKLDHVVNFINRYRDSENELRVIEQFSIGDNRVDFALLKGIAEFLFVEAKESLGINPGGIVGMKSLPKSLDPVLEQAFGYSLKAGIPKVIVTDGIVYIIIDIWEKRFFSKKRLFMKSHIVPYQFQIMHFQDALFNRGFINWILEAEQTRESRIKEMEPFYLDPQQNKPSQQNNPTQKTPKGSLRKARGMGNRRYLAKNPIARLFNL